MDNASSHVAAATSRPPVTFALNSVIIMAKGRFCLNFTLFDCNDSVRKVGYVDGDSYDGTSISVGVSKKIGSVFSPKQQRHENTYQVPNRAMCGRRFVIF